jgi:hypothetical protein
MFAWRLGGLLSCLPSYMARSSQIRRRVVAGSMMASDEWGGGLIRRHHEARNETSPIRSNYRIMLPTNPRSAALIGLEKLALYWGMIGVIQQYSKEAASLLIRGWLRVVDDSEL